MHSTLFKFYSKTFPEGSSRFLGTFLKEATMPLRTSVCRNLGKGVALYMAGAADTIMVRTGDLGRMERYIPWTVNTASLFPETVFYALSIDMWTRKQKEAFEMALENMTGRSLVIWTSADTVSVPAILLENGYVTHDAYENGGFCFQAVAPEDTDEHFSKSGYRVKNSERLPGEIRGDAKNAMYEIGFIANELERAVTKRRRDPFGGTQVNIPKETVPIPSPYMILPDDDIEEARYRAMKALGYKACSITKPATVSEKIPDSYNWIAEAMEGRAKVPALDMEKIRKRREKKKKKES